MSLNYNYITIVCRLLAYVIFFVLFCADVEIQCDGLRTRTSAGGHVDGDNGRVRGRRAGRSPPSPPLGRPPPDDVKQRRGRVVVAVVVGNRSPA